MASAGCAINDKESTTGYDPKISARVSYRPFNSVYSGGRRRSRKHLFLRQVQHLLTAAWAVIGGDEMIADRQ
jgi:hypothetical protein